MKYSLANYTVTFTSTDKYISAIIGALSIGGGLSGNGDAGEVMESISISRDEALYSVDGYATGGYVFNKNLCRTGSIELSLNQLCDKIPTLKYLCERLLEIDESAGLTITVKDSQENPVVDCIDCFPEKIPDQTFKETADNQSWKFLAGQVNFR